MDGDTEMRKTSSSFQEEVLNIKIYSDKYFIRLLQKIGIIHVMTFREVNIIYNDVLNNIYGL